ncbi:glycosyl hydrolase [Bacillus sp. HMF5848]|uniref:glycosyl hydrolase n=1 Tax=Bacillus sp. HMF5848 TaxID=2495421 RepID=UPI00163AA297|nr:glycosyl hydrolase [Bacillus sp. HMF5848]
MNASLKKRIFVWTLILVIMIGLLPRYGLQAVSASESEEVLSIDFESVYDTEGWLADSDTGFFAEVPVTHNAAAGALELGVKYTGGGWEEARFKKELDGIDANALEYDLYIPKETWDDGSLYIQNIAKLGSGWTWTELSIDEIPASDKESMPTEEINGTTYVKLQKVDEAISGVLQELYIRIAGKNTTFTDSILIDNMKLLNKASDHNNTSDELTFTFNSDLEGWQEGWESDATLNSFTHSTDVGSGAIKVDVTFDETKGWSAYSFKKIVGPDFSFDNFESISYEIFVPKAQWSKGILKVQTGLNNDWQELKINEFDINSLDVEAGTEYVKLELSVPLDLGLSNQELVIGLAGVNSDYSGPIYIDNYSLVKRQSSSNPGNATNELAIYTFDSDIAGWSNAGTWQAKFGSLAIEHSNDLGDGALKINAVLSGDNTWEELKIKNNVPEISQATKVSFDLYIDLSISDLDSVQEKEIKPYIIIQDSDGNFIKIGEGLNNKTLSALETITLNGKEYGKVTVENVILPTEAENKTELWICFVSDSIPYTGPIYIDNVKILNAPLGGGDQEELVDPNNNQPIIPTDNFDLSDVNLVDSNATAETKSLFAYLKNTRKEYTLFGQQHATSRGVTISTQDGTQSDIYNNVGAFPAIYGWDIDGLWNPGESGPGETIEERAAIMDDWITKAYDRGGIVTLSAHMQNFVTGGAYYDTTGNVVKRILPGGDHHAEYNAYLDEVAAFANGLQGSDGKDIPILFRPFHENNGSWFWWGAIHCTKDDYINLFRYTVEYLRDQKGVDNFLYVYSPNGPFKTKEQYLDRYPGDDYIDVIGYDQYHDRPSEGDGVIDAMVNNARIVVEIAKDKGKIPTFSEVGIRWNGSKGLSNSNNAIPDWFTRFHEKLMADETAKQIAYTMHWANWGLDQYFIPFKGHPVLGNHEMINNFIEFYNSDTSVFGDRLAGVYDLAVNTSSEEPFMYIVTPSNRQEISGTTKIRAKIANYDKEISKVVYSTPATTEEEMKLEGNYYTADWTPKAAVNGQEINLTVKVVYVDGTADDQTVNVNVFAEIPLKEVTFNSGIEGATFDGVYAAAGSVEGAVKHESSIGSGALAIDVHVADDGDNTNWTYQKAAVKLPGINNMVNMSEVNKIKFDIILPELTDLQIPKVFGPVVGLSTPASYKKLGEGLTDFGYSEMDIKDGYAKKTIEIIFTEEPTATDMVIEFVTKDWNYEGPIYIDNIQFINRVEKPVADPSLVDDFEGYDGDSSFVNDSYLKHGEQPTISLVQEPKNSGNYAMRYDYTLAPTNYTGIGKGMNDVDWSPYNAVQFWIQPDGTGQKVVVQINASGIPFEAYPDISDTTARIETIPFSEFKPAPWYSDSTKVLNHETASDIQSFNIYVNEVNNVLTESVLYFDDIKAVIMPDEGGHPVLTYDSATIDADEKIVRLTFSSELDPEQDLNNIKENITYSTNGIDFLPLDDNDLLSVDGSALIITFSEKLSGETRIIKFDGTSEAPLKAKDGSMLSTSFTTEEIKVVDECFIATAAYGTKYTPAVSALRKFRDEFLLTNTIGRKFVNFYYNNSPSIAANITDSEFLKSLIRIALLPVVGMAYMMLNPIATGSFLASLLLIGFWFVRRLKIKKA